MTADIIRTANTITALGTRTLEATNAKVAGYGTRKLSERAELESRRVVAAAAADLAQTALERWIKLLYHRSEDGQIWYNVRTDHMIWLAPPWSRSRYSAYGLTEPQARLLLRIRKECFDTLHISMQLYVYSPVHQRFFLNRHKYPTLDLAIRWQQTTGAITTDMWHTFNERYPGGRL